jgi:hypothetical protein
VVRHAENLNLSTDPIHEHTLLRQYKDRCSPHSCQNTYLVVINRNVKFRRTHLLQNLPDNDSEYVHSHTFQIRE